MTHIIINIACFLVAIPLLAIFSLFMVELAYKPLYWFLGKIHDKLIGYRAHV